MASLRFLDYLADLDRRELRRGEAVLHLHPRAFDTLAFLLQNAGRILSKDEIFAAVWPDVVVGENNLAQMIRELRETFNDDVRNPRFIRTIPRKGYVFLPAVEAEGGAATEPAEAPVAIPAARPGWRGWRKPPLLAGGLALLLVAGGLGVWWLRPRRQAPPAIPVALAPFQVIGDRQDLGWLERGLEGILTTEVTQDNRLRLVRTPAVNSAAELLDAAHKAGARSLISGSLLATGDRFQLDLNLLDAGSGQIQASFQTRGQIQDGVLLALDSLSAQLRQRLTGAAALLSPAGSELPTRNLGAYRHYLTALDAAALGGRDSLLQARSEFAVACHQDPQFALAALHLREVDQKLDSYEAQPASANSDLACPPPQESALPAPVRLFAQGVLHPDLPVSTRVASLELLVRQYPDFALQEGAPEDLVRVFWEAGDPGSAEDLARFYAQDPDMPAYYRANINDDLARLLGSRGRYDEAIQAIHQAEALRPTHGEGYLEHRYWLARMTLSAGRRAEALQILHALLPPAEQTHSGLLLSDLGWGFYMAGERTESRHLTEEALASSPRFWNAWSLLGWLDLTDHHPVPAGNEFAQAFALSPGHDLPSLYYEGVALKEAGRLAQAQSIFEHLVQEANLGTWNDDGLVHHAYPSNLVALSLADAQLGHAQQARQEVAQAFSAAQGNGEDLYQCAVAFALLQDSENARQALSQAIAAGYRNFQHIRDNPAFAGAMRPVLQVLDQTVGAGHPQMARRRS